MGCEEIICYKMKYTHTERDLEVQYQDHLRFLEKSCREYDEGDFSEAKRMAVSLRVLLHNTKNSKSLFSQLKMDDFLFWSSGDLYTPSNLLSSFPLCTISITAKEVLFHPLLSGNSTRTFYLRFDDWWNEIIFDDKNSFLTRRDIILYVADKDGGAHVDPILDEIYADLVKRNFLNFSVSNNGFELTPRNNPAFAALRQISFELLQSVKINNQKCIQKAYPKRLFEMRFVDNSRRFKWSATDIIKSEETMEIVEKFNSSAREYFVFKPLNTDKPSFEVII